MLAQRYKKTQGTGTRRGVTLVEMLVTVAVLVIMMTILVQIFQSATGAISSAKALQQLDDQLRRIDGILRSDLGGVTARFTPPLDPTLNLGYFEYGENEFADNQGEDGDDYIRFTAKAPPGQPFTGRFWPNYWTQTTTNPLGGSITQTFGPGANNSQNFPITITSDYAEIIYFLRNGNLYRRVFLIAPELQSAVTPTISNTVYGNAFTTFQPTIFGQAVSWQGVNDLSAHPSPSGPTVYPSQTPAQQLAQAQGTIILNTLGNLTNRENRAFNPRFTNDAMTATASGYSQGPDGIPDDVNGDNIPDLYPSLYANIFAPTTGGAPLVYAPPLVGTPTGLSTLLSNPDAGALDFPYIFPGAYSKAQALSNYAYGAIHSPTPYANVAGSVVRFDQNPTAYLNALNHHPLEVGDNLPTPLNPPLTGQLSSMLSSWWGFPTWRETLSPYWTDPTWQVNVNAGAQPLGLLPTMFSFGAGMMDNSGQGDNGTLPPTTSFLTVSGVAGDYLGLRNANEIFSDGSGTSTSFVNFANWTTGTTLWQLSWEDDLIMTGVRSFDVKAYDNALANYADLGWGDDLRLPIPLQNGQTANTLPFLTGNPDYYSGTNFPPLARFQYNFVDYINQTFAHEGRMPPLVLDNRLDYQYPNPYYMKASSYVAQYPNLAPAYSSNIGDNNNQIPRLRRVWDSWSTDYSRAPAIGVNTATNGFPAGPPITPPIYPSYPPPYPAPLQGIQIQIRVVDPSNQRAKQLTIRQDFTDKL